MPILPDGILLLVVDGVIVDIDPAGIVLPGVVCIACMNGLSAFVNSKYASRSLLK